MIVTLSETLSLVGQIPIPEPVRDGAGGEGFHQQALRCFTKPVIRNEDFSMTIIG